MYYSSGTCTLQIVMLAVELRKLELDRPPTPNQQRRNTSTSLPTFTFEFVASTVEFRAEGGYVKAPHRSPSLSKAIKRQRLGEVEKETTGF